MIINVRGREIMKVSEAARTSMRASLTETTVKNNVGKLKSAIKTAAQLRQLGVTVFDCDRVQAVATVEEVLSL
jgi:N-dimethylarginine dimethylaminohydrolase